MSHNLGNTACCTLVKQFDCTARGAVAGKTLIANAHRPTSNIISYKFTKNSFTLGKYFSNVHFDHKWKVPEHRLQVHLPQCL